MSANRNPFAHLRCAALSDVGRKRKNNEDAAASFPRRGVWCVADGMGGGDDGEIASGAVVRAIDACLVGMPVPDEGDYSADTVVRFLSRAIGDASAWISDRAVKKGLNGCGSTVVGVVFDPTCPGTALAFHVGDSRLYRLHGREIRQITKDHSVEELMGAKEGKTLNPMFRGMILRAVGIERTVEIETTKFPVHEGDVVLLCSDGLSRMLKDRQIADIVREAEGDMDVAASRLVAAANEAGGVDNITVVLVRVGALPAASAAAHPPHDAESSSTGSTGSLCMREEEEHGVVPFLRRYGWRAAIVALAALGGAVFAYFVATAPLQDSDIPPPKPALPAATVPKPTLPVPAPSPSVPVVQSTVAKVPDVPKTVDVPKVTDVPKVADVPSVTDVPKVADVPSVTDVPKVADVPSVADVPPPSARKVTERTAAEMREDRERQEALAQLKAERAHRAQEEAVAAMHEDERMALARKLAACYYRDEFAAFARAANRVLGDGATGRLQTLGRTLYLRKGGETAGEVATEFISEACSLAVRIVATPVDPKLAAACRALARADPSSSAAQQEFLNLLKQFSTPKGGE